MIIKPTARLRVEVAAKFKDWWEEEGKEIGEDDKIVALRIFTIGFLAGRTPSSIVKRMDDPSRMFLFASDLAHLGEEHGMNRVICPGWRADHSQCDGVVHIISTCLGDHLPESKSGAGLTIRMECEQGHRFELEWVDHSACLFLGLHHYGNAPEVEF